MGTTKNDIIDAVAEETGYPKSQVKAVQDAILDKIQGELVNGQKVTLTGFGTLQTRVRAERQGTNPSTGEPMVIPARRVVKFKVGKTLKDAVKDA